MEDLWTQMQGYMTAQQMMSLSRAVLLAGAGLLVAKIVARAVRRLGAERLDPTQQQLITRVGYWGVLSLFLVASLHQLGFNLGVLLGAAGILSVALGFASQTSASNLVSGLFLIGERPFEIGDLIQVSGTTGEVLSIDLLSVKLRTFDNLFVRIPNETLIKTEVRTLTKFPIRRFDLKIGVAYKEDVERVREVLFAVADRNPICLDEPKPQFWLQGFGDSAVEIQFSIWALQPNYFELRTAMQLEIKRAFDREGIEIPFPHRSLYAGAASDPFPVRLVGADPSLEPAIPTTGV